MFSTDVIYGGFC